MKKLKVCIVGNDYKQQFPLLDYGGIESSVENTAIGLHEKFKDEVNFCAIVPKILSNKRDYGFKIIETNETETSISQKPVSFFIQEVKKILLNTRTKPDVIWCQSHWSALELWDLNIPLICTSQDSAINEGASGKFIFKPNVYYRFVSKFLLENNFNLNDSVQFKIYNNSFYLHTGLTDENFQFFPNKKNYVLWVAGLNWGMEAKGLTDFIQLAETNPSTNFVCYGTGNVQIENFLYQTSNRLKNFIFKGKLNRGIEHATAFGEAKFFIMPTKTHEAFGRTVVEALSKGTPVLGYNSGAIPELLLGDSDAGQVFKIGDIQSMSKELNKPYDYEKCYNFSKKFHIDNEIKNLIEKSFQICK